MPSRLSWLTLFQSSATITYIEHVWKQQTVILLNLGPSKLVTQVNIENPSAMFKPELKVFS